MAMCGRFVLSMLEQISERFSVENFSETKLTPRFNVAPTDGVAIIRTAERGRVVETVRWGLIPSWSKDRKGPLLINVRSETAGQKFKGILSRRRCLVPANGFYEWRKLGESKTPMFIHLPGMSLFAFAGLWDEWISEDGEVVRSCGILTTEANRAISGIHQRMPVVFQPQAEAVWLDPGVSDVQKLEALLKPCPDELIEMHAVSSRVNSVRNDSPDLIEPRSAE